MRKRNKSVLNIMKVLAAFALALSFAALPGGPWNEGAFVYAEEGSDDIYLMGYADYDKAYEVLDSINRERSKRGLATLSMDQTLMDAAMVRAAETVLYFEHARPNGSKWNSINSRINGENLGKGTDSVSRIMSLWMKSTGHKENIVRSKFRSVGVACFECRGVTYWVQLYGISGSEGAERPKSEPISVGIDLPEGGGFTPAFEITEGIGGEPVAGGDAAGEAAGIRMFEGDRLSLGLSGGGLTFDPAKLSWTVSDPEVATVDDNGVLVVTGCGDATVTAASGTTKRASFKIATKKHINDTYIIDSFSKTEDITKRKYLDAPVCPQLTVIGEDGLLEEGVDYTIYYEDNAAAGTGEIEIRGMGDYGGIATKLFEIN